MATLILMMSITLTGCTAAGAHKTGFSSHKVNGDLAFDYYLYTPESDGPVPLVIVFHGYGEDKNLPRNRTLDTLTSPENQAVRPCYIFAPAVEDRIYLARSERDKLYEYLHTEADIMISEGKVDPDRVYVMGNSFGGLGTVEFVEAYPDSVAGAIVMCPALTYDDRTTRDLGRIVDVPLWFAQATNDNVIPITVSRSAVSTLEALGADEVRFTEFTDDVMLSTGALVGYHQADFAVMADETFMEWLFSQSR